MDSTNGVTGSPRITPEQQASQAPPTTPLTARTSTVGQKVMKNASQSLGSTELPEGFRENAQRIANKLQIVTRLINDKNAGAAKNVIARWRGESLDLRTLDKDAGPFATIGFKIIKTFMHEKSWKEKVINDLDYLDKNLPESEQKTKILSSALKAAMPILETGSFFGTLSSIDADRRLRNLNNKLNPPKTSKPSTDTKENIPAASTEKSIQAAKKLSYGKDKPAEVDFSHAAGMTIATSVGGHLGTGGFTSWTSAQEVLSLEQLMKAESKPTPELSNYHRAAVESLPLNVRVQIAQKNSLSKDASYFSGLAADYKQAIMALKDGPGKYVFMDCNFKGHCMRAVFSMDENDIVKAQLFDTSGEIESREGNFITATLRLLLGGKQKVCLEIEILPGQFEENGQAWLEQLIGMDSKDTREKMGHQLLSSEEMSAAYRRVFSSIRSTADVVAMAPVQTTGNCYAKRLEAAQLELLGPTTYLKLRLEQYSLLEAEIKNHTRSKDLELGEPKKLSLSEYIKVRNQLRRIPEDNSLAFVNADNTLKEAFWKMFQHDRAVMLEELKKEEGSK